ncbi:MAG: exodeoxyribonuclease VII small subunit [Proteobacteria bacterium]|nr:MAG: exodeoxyribonuclease VII small subunit [Pseudomonadota bacterium]
MAKKTPPSFEKALEELEHIIEQMEQGEISLEESLKSFERGIYLTRTCQQALRNAEQKVQQLVEKNGTARLEPFDREED